MLLQNTHTQTQSPVTVMCYFFKSCWPVGPIDFQTLQVITNAFGYHAELDGKIHYIIES